MCFLGSSDQVWRSFRPKQADPLLFTFAPANVSACGVEKPLFDFTTPDVFTSPHSPPQSSPTPSNTPPPSPTAPAHIPPIPHLESPAHSSFRPQNSKPHTRTPPRFPTTPHNSTISTWLLPPPSRAPQNSRTQTPPAAPSAQAFVRTG